MEVGGSDAVADGRARRDRGAGGRRRIATADCARRHRDGPATRTPVARGMPCDIEDDAQRDGTPASDAQGSGAGSAVSCGRTIGADEYDGHGGGSAYGGSAYGGGPYDAYGGYGGSAYGGSDAYADGYGGYGDYDDGLGGAYAGSTYDDDRAPAADGPPGADGPSGAPAADATNDAAASAKAAEHESARHEAAAADAMARASALDERRLELEASLKASVRVATPARARTRTPPGGGHVVPARGGGAQPPRAAADGQPVPDADRAATLKRFRKAFGSAPPAD